VPGHLIPIPPGPDARGLGYEGMTGVRSRRRGQSKASYQTVVMTRL